MLKNYNFKNIIIIYVLVGLVSFNCMGKNNTNITKNINMIGDGVKELKSCVEKRREEISNYDRHLNNIYRLFDIRENVRKTKPNDLETINRLERMINYTKTFDEAYFSRYDEQIKTMD